MFRVYAKIRSSACFTFKSWRQALFVLFTASALAGCADMGGAYHMPWSTPTNTGVVTKDPNSIPDIAWQTQNQRKVLVDQNKAIEHATDLNAGVPDLPKSSDFAGAAVPSGKITVSLLVPLSGKKADLGQSMMKAAQMALFDIGSANFELVPHDTKSTKEGAMAAAEAAVKSGTSLILGPVFAEDLKAVKPIASAAHVPVVSFTTDWTLADNNTYIMGFLPFTQVTRVVKYAQEKGYSKLAVYAPQTEYCDVVIRTVEKTGVPIAHVSRYSPQQSDLSALVQDFASISKVGDSNQLDFDMLMLPLGSEGLRTLVTVLSQNGIDQQKIKFIGTGLWDDTSLTSNPALFGGWFAAPDPNLRADFEKHYQENYGAAPMRLASLAYDATALAAVLARNAGSKEPYSHAALSNPRGFAGIDGVFRFRADGLSERGLAVLEIRSGKAVVVDPAPTAFISSGS